MIFTGEIGDQLFGGPKLAALIPYCAQTKEVDPWALARLWIHLSGMNRKPSVRTTPYYEWLFWTYPKAREVYQELIEHIAELFLGIQTGDLVNRFLLMNLIIKGPFRMWSYSQDNLTYAHPFADWDLVEYAMTLQSKVKIYDNGTLKRVLFDIWREYVPETIWKKPKGAPRIANLPGI